MGMSMLQEQNANPAHQFLQCTKNLASRYVYMWNNFKIHFGFTAILLKSIGAAKNNLTQILSTL